MEQPIVNPFEPRIRDEITGIFVDNPQHEAWELGLKDGVKLMFRALLAIQDNRRYQAWRKANVEQNQESPAQ